MQCVQSTSLSAIFFMLSMILKLMGLKRLKWLFDWLAVCLSIISWYVYVVLDFRKFNFLLKTKTWVFIKISNCKQSIFLMTKKRHILIHFILTFFKLHILHSFLLFPTIFIYLSFTLNFPPFSTTPTRSLNPYKQLFSQEILSSSK